MTTSAKTSTHESVPNTPRVSVVIPCYGCADTITTVIDALQAQSIQPLEIIVVNDNSPDQLDQVIAPYLDDIIYIKHPTNQGLARSYNDGLAQARAPYAMTLHSDCILDPNYIELLLEHMEQNPQLGAVTGQYLFDEVTQLALSDRMFMALNRIPVLMDRTDRSVQAVNFIEGKADLFRRSVLEKYGFFNTNLALTAEDQELSARMRRDGYLLLQDARTRFRVMFTKTSDSLGKVLYKQRTYARGQAYVMLKFRGNAFSATTQNRKERARHRLQQIAFPPLFTLSILVSLLIPAIWGLTVLLLLARCGMYYFMSSPFSMPDRLIAACLGPIADVYYWFGAVEGVLKTVILKKT